MIAYSHHRHKQESYGNTKPLLLQIIFSATALCFLIKPFEVCTHEVKLKYIYRSPSILTVGFLYLQQLMGSREIHIFANILLFWSCIRSCPTPLDHGARTYAYVIGISRVDKHGCRTCIYVV